MIRPIGAEGLDRRGPAGSCRLFLGPGFRLGARWNRLIETVKTRKKREKTEKKWARYGLKRVNKERTGGINWFHYLLFVESDSRRLTSRRLCSNGGPVDLAENAANNWPKRGGKYGPLLTQRG